MSLANARRRFDVISFMTAPCDRQQRAQRGAVLADAWWCVWMIVKGALFTGGFILGAAAIIKGLDAFLDELH